MSAPRLLDTGAFRSSLIIVFVCFRWGHACSLDTLTLSLLLKHQGASLRTLHFRQCNGLGKKAHLAKLGMEGLTTFCVPELDAQGHVGDWPFDLLAKNHKSLRHLQLGSEMDLALEYANEGDLDYDETARFKMTDTFAESMNLKFDGLNEPSSSNSPLQLESLSLIGLHVGVLATASFPPVIDFNSLGMLILESCAGLEAAFSLLIESGAGRPKAKSKLRLHTFVIRHENTTDEFQQELETFILSLKPLTNLHVLMEGRNSMCLGLREVLKLHGKRLRSLIWDERESPRVELQQDITCFPQDYENLELIATHCAGLRALGISLDWGDIARSRKNHKKARIIAILPRPYVLMLISYRFLFLSLAWNNSRP